MAKIAVLLSGCGVFDGAEIHESVLSLLALHEAGAEVSFVAPDVDQHHVINHQQGAEESGGARNVRVESARIARGAVLSLDEVRAEDFDGIVFPGGFGVAKNFCDFAFKGTEGNPLPAMADFLRAARAAGRPIGFACISPALAAMVFREGRLTLGRDDDDYAAALRAFGVDAVACAGDEIVIDEERKIASTPAYMLELDLPTLREGLKKLVDQVLRWAGDAKLTETLAALPDWSLRGGALSRRWTFDNFAEALAFTNRLGALAEAEGHHPDLELGWGYVSLRLFTHDINGLSEKDFALARAIEAL